jgi:CMP-N,N'-diacetyllegionaminic acid synthase
MKEYRSDLNSDLSKNSKIIGIIPARGGSKGLPGKNIYPLDDIPLIAHSINAAGNSKYLKNFVVSTDDEEIKKVAHSYGSVVIDRPTEFAQDDSSTFDAVKHVLSFLESQNKYFDTIVLLEPTSPLRKKNDIDDAIELFLKNEGENALVSVSEIALEKPFHAKIVKDGFLLNLLSSPDDVSRRQDMPVSYFPYGVIYIISKRALFEHKTFFPPKSIPYFLERWQNYEVDDVYDIKCIEAIINFRKENNYE